MPCASRRRRRIGVRPAGGTKPTNSYNSFRLRGGLGPRDRAAPPSRTAAVPSVTGELPNRGKEMAPRSFADERGSHLGGGRATMKGQQRTDRNSRVSSARGKKRPPAAPPGRGRRRRRRARAGTDDCSGSQSQGDREKHAHSHAVLGPHPAQGPLCAGAGEAYEP